MSNEISLDPQEAESILEYMHSALEKGEWNGVPVSWEQDHEFQSEIVRKIKELFFPNYAGSIDFLTLASYCTSILASSGKTRSFTKIEGRNPPEISLPSYSTIELANEPSDPIFDPSKHLIQMICGINNSETDIQNHVEYLKSLYPGIEIQAISNKSHGAFIDGLEVFFLNYPGISPNTSCALRQSWEAFDLKHREAPTAEILLFCHSQGAIHVENALRQTPERIQKRLRIIALAPASLLSSHTQAHVTRYVSQSDPTFGLEAFWRSITDSPEEGLSESTRAALRAQDLVRTLKPDLEAPFFDHGFQSPTFREVIRGAIYEYLRGQW